MTITKPNVGDAGPGWATTLNAALDTLDTRTLRIFDIRDAAGMTDMLIRDNHLGDALAKVLADKPVALMRGHGSVVVGNSIQQAVYRIIYTDVNARLQMDAARLGSITFLSPEEAAKSAANLDAQVPRAWELWKSRIGKID